jgi:N-acyl-D-glutamate deacylase
MNIATPEQLSQILKLVAQGLDEGALGIGINAGYAPGHGQKEYFALAEMAAERGVATFTHVRYASNMEPQSSFQAVQELIANAAITGAHMHLCHINSTSLKDIHSILKLVDDAFERKINISVGAYPWGLPAPSWAPPCSAVKAGASAWDRRPITSSWAPSA